MNKLNNINNLEKQLIRSQKIERVIKAQIKASPATTPKSKSNSVLEEAFRVFVHEASQANSGDQFLECLRELTGQDTVENMVKRFRKLAGIDK